MTPRPITTPRPGLFRSAVGPPRAARRWLGLALLLIPVRPEPAPGQQPDTTRTRADTTAPAQQRGPVNPRLLPDISLVGDLIFDLSRRGSTQEDGSRFGVREIELQISAAVDPYFRGDVLLSYSDLEGVAVEQALMATTALPWHLEAQLGRIFLPFGKQNTTHREALHTIEYPWVLQRFLSSEGLKGTGALLRKAFAPFGFYQELLVTVSDRFGEAPEDLTPEEPANRNLSGLGYGARLRNYWDLTPNANLELSASAATGKVPRPIEGGVDFDAVNARQTVLGVDVTYRWRPLGRGLYQSFILQAEYLRQINEQDPALPSGVQPDQYLGPRRAFDGAYLWARYQLTRRTYLGVRGDLVEDPEADGGMLRAASAYWQYFPSEFSKVALGFERVMPPGASGYNRLILQTTFTVGPHRPHPF